ncbi:hypothetical protein LZ554_004425 [Drepanopeziza brunnea f. sp. 'monogermtubi']|nr:hypothetical protein LZ554_004425 [Drepanopeziza brunnea f. sp. 'monogermtubi']
MPYDNPLGASYSSNHSATSSYSDASSATWESSTVYTPMSTPRRGSPNSGSVKRESSAVSAPTPVSTPDRYANINGFNAMNALTQGMMVGYQQQMDFTPSQQPTLAPEVNMPQVSMAEMDYGPYLDSSLCNSFTAYDGLPLCAPSLENELFSPMSDMSCPTPLSNSCVVPSQTNFMDLYTIQSPIKSLHLSMDYEHASPECDSGFSMSDCSPQSMRYMMPDAEHQLPECSTPSRPSNFRDSRNGNDHGGLLDYQVPFYDKPTPAADSEPKTPARREAPAAKLPRKKSSSAAKREDRSGGGSGKYGSITAVSRAGHFCSHPSCGGKFVRLEHLKRHGRTHQPPRSPVPCEFCKKIFPADRMDNIKAHVLRHAVPGARSRTQYHPDAYALWLSMEKKPRKGSAAAVSNNNNSNNNKKKIKAEGGGQEGTAARSTTAGPGSRPRTVQAGCGGPSARSS